LRLASRKQDVLRFLNDPDVPFTTIRLNAMAASRAIATPTRP
jgi:hypothetical protein